mmetsp:Transcript_87761/g.204241  ORF Transcript_87761/g.204241 Transcript_87761/m.204241 type:complete len:98 (+) Transcript_87761:85-378(+)|eukprot:CAMPEP_0171092952 /NCGR_PEP_ID=MMETSP0766_2-20121228/38337_1 /TAXON_ID=439317 /ORGANISM="Gambierdiscus australes, Strain CAWD 149" /LENGTH=97 /DNA_ID=CAMNT_0011551303 /DNA_START=98 /DNA_END=391 /DNA_ORIENTATION=+
MSAQETLNKAGIIALMEAAEAPGKKVDTLGGFVGEMGGSIRSGVPVPGLSGVVPATMAVFPVVGPVSGPITRGQIQAKRIGSRYGPGVVPPTWLARA